jgi:hypothetical protein
MINFQAREAKEDTAIRSNRKTWDKTQETHNIYYVKLYIIFDFNSFISSAYLLVNHLIVVLLSRLHLFLDAEVA